MDFSHRKIVTLEQFIIESEQQASAKGDFSQLLRDISLAAKLVNREVNKAGLVDILGEVESSNVHGETQKKLDVFANEVFIEALAVGGKVCAIASEENEGIIPVDTPQSRDAKYVVLMDPLDGSSNIDVNVSIGTIFSVYRRKSSLGGPGTIEDCLQKGSEQVAAGYVIYGSSTMCVYTTGHGVNGFTLDPSIGEFLLSHLSMQVPPKGSIYSLNEGNYRRFEPGLKEYLRHIKAKFDPSVKPYSSRYIGSLVADFHRNLLKGGIFIYPSFIDQPEGKLRLMYEGNPMAFLMEQAGGMATNGRQRILDIQPTDLHQRTPLILGNKAELAIVHDYLLNYEVKNNK